MVKKILAFMVTLHLSVAPLAANFIESIQLQPNWIEETTHLVLEITGGKRFELNNVLWEELAELHLNIGDQIGVFNEELDFSNYGYSSFELFFMPGIKMKATGLSTSPLPLGPIDGPKTIFNLSEIDNNCSFITDGGAHWMVDREEPFAFQNGDVVFMKNEKILPYLIGASQYDVVLDSGEKVGVVIGDSTYWELLSEGESQYPNRIFNIKTKYDYSYQKFGSSGFLGLA